MPTLKIKYKIYFFNLSLYNVDYFHFISFDFMRIATCDLALALSHRGCNLEYFKIYDQFTLLDLQVILYLDLIKIDT
jgi:hypothetical protein